MENETYFYVSAIVLLILLLVSTFYGLRQQIKQIRHEKNRKIRKIECLKKQLSEKEGLLKEVASDFDGSFPYLLRLMESLSLEYFDKGKGADCSDKVLPCLNPVIERIIKEERFCTVAENWLDRNDGGLVKMFRKDFPNLNEWEYELFVYYNAGLSARTISLFQRVEVSTIHKRKANLKRKLNNSDCRNVAEYLSKLEGVRED